MTRWLVIPLLLAFASAASADPLRAIPASATLVVHVEKPRKLVEAVTTLDPFRQYETLPQVKALLDSAQARQGFQFLTHLEKQLGAKWPELLDKLGGGGIAVGAIPGTEPAPVTVAFEGTSEKAVADGFELAIGLIETELTRQSGAESTVKLPRGTHKGATTLQVGPFNIGRTGKTILIASAEKLLHDAIARLADAQSESVLSVKELVSARSLLPANPLASLWFNLKPVKETKASKDFFEATRKDFLQTMVVGSSVDAVRRSNFVTVGLFETPKGLKLSVRMPAKRDGLPKEFGLHVPMSGSTPGTLPLLEPPGALYSQSLHLDLAAMWKDRKELFNEQVLKDIEEGVKGASKVLPNVNLESLFALSGPHHRFVAVERGTDHYAVKPGSPLPEMALVSTMRDKEFANQFGTTLRTAGIVASLQFKLKMTEETHDGVKIVSYRFSEKDELPGDTDNFRFNFVPCFAATDKEFIAATSPKLLKDLLAELKKPATGGTSPAVWRGKFFAGGAASAIRARPDPVITNAVLGRGISLKQAKGEVAELATFLESLGTVGFAMDHGTDAFKFDLEWTRK